MSEFFVNKIHKKLNVKRYEFYLVAMAHIVDVEYYVESRNLHVAFR